MSILRGDKPLDTITSVLTHSWGSHEYPGEADLRNALSSCKLIKELKSDTIAYYILNSAVKITILAMIQPTRVLYSVPRWEVKVLTLN